MDSASSPSLPFTSDPGDWEDHLNPVVLPSSTNSDDFEALHAVHEETIARKNKEGVVIQHRAWSLGEAFRREVDYPQGTSIHMEIH
jgi:chromosome transmission fidelity protein 18